MNNQQKSILIINTPGTCKDCPLSYNGYDGYGCRITGTYFQNEIPKECPLTPLPPYKDLTQYVQQEEIQCLEDELQYIHDQGWNECLYSIIESQNNGT